MPSVSFTDNKPVMRALRIISGETGRSVGSLVEEAVTKTYREELDRILGSSFFAKDVPETGHEASPLEHAS